MSESDKVLVKSFGFSYDDELNRYVAMFLTDLAQLSPEHQQVWRAKQRTGTHRLHPDYYRSQILAEFPERIPIFTAFIMEMELINQMAQAMGRPNFFRQVPSERRRPPSVWISH